MSEQEHERPLTRREMRMREQATQDASEQLNGELAEAEMPTEVEEPEAPILESVNIEIDPLNDDGTPRTRRELRELREAALAELAEEQAIRSAQNAAESDSVGEEDASEDDAIADDAGADGADEESDLEDEAAAGEAVETDLDSANDNFTEADELVDDSFGAPTEAFSLEELLDAAEPNTPTGDADAVAALFAETDASEEGEPAIEDGSEPSGDEAVDAEAVDALVEEVDAIDVEAESDSSVDAGVVDGSIVEDGVDEVGVDEDGVDDSAEIVEVIEVDDAEDVDSADVEAVVSNEETSAEVDTDVVTEVESDPSPVPAPKSVGYSFPDIQPPEEWRSVFDDPSRAAKITASDSSGDFDDLISRAVAQEGSTGSTGTSALILPSHPGDTGGLSGPLGVTGELFITGSIELPKQLGETGGHAAISDAHKLDPYLSDDHTDSLSSVSDSGSTPVSAMSAVSARRRPEVPVVAEPTKDRSKAPLVLAISGGALIVVLGGAVIFAATQGLFG